MEFNKNYFEKKVFFNKLKSKSKSLLITNFKPLETNFIINDKKNNSLIIKKIYFELNNNSSDYTFVEDIISKMKIRICTSRNPKNIQSGLILEIPGYICGFKFISSTLLELNIYFENFLPNGLILPHHLYSSVKNNQNNKDNDDNKNNEDIFIENYNGFSNFFDAKINLMILFNKLVKDDLILSSHVDYLYEYVDIENNEICLNIEKNIYFIDPPYNCVKHKTIFIQQTQTQSNKIKNIITTNNNFNTNYYLRFTLYFNYMCRGFWIKINKYDYEKLLKIKLVLNGHDSFDLDIFQLDMLEVDKKYIDDSIVFFINLEFGSNQWNLPNTVSESKKMYSNSLNLSRIDQSNIIFVFDSNKLIGDYIYITSLYLNLFDIRDTSYNLFF